MTQNLPNKSYRLIGDGVGTETRRSVTFTPDADMTLRHWSFIGMRVTNPALEFIDHLLNEVDTMEWEIRTTAGDHTPNTTSASLLASGSFDFRYTSSWKLNRPIKYTITLVTPLELTGSTEYSFILKVPDDEPYLKYPLGWVDTYVSGAAGEVDASVCCAEYASSDSTWHNPSNTYNLTLYVLDDQAGETWHVVIDGNGYMQPDRMKGYRCEQAASGLAQSRGGQAEYSQLRYPYSNFSQDNWTSGSGQLEMDDPSAFLYAMTVDTTVPHQTILGPRVYLTGIESDNPEYDPTTVVARLLPDTDNSDMSGAACYFAQKFTCPTEDLTASAVGARIAKMPWAFRHTVSIGIYDDVGGEPGALLTGWQETTPTFKWAWRDEAIDYLLTGDTDYWVVVKTDQYWGFAAEHRLMFDTDGSAPGGAAMWSKEGTDWTELTGYSMCFRINYGAAAAMNGNVMKIVYGQVDSTDNLYCVAGKEVYQWDETNQHWDPLTAELTADGTDLICFNDLLLVAQGYNNNAKTWDGTVWADAGDAFKYFHIGKGYLWATVASNEVRHSNDAAAWSSSVYVGEDIWDITAFANYQGRLIVGKENGLWEIDDQDLAIEYLRFDEHANPENCKGMTVWSGMLFLPVHNTIWRWQGSQYRDVGPTDKRAGPTKDWPNKITRMTSTPPMLLACATPIVDTGAGGIMAYNGMGWHHLTWATRIAQDAYAIAVTTELGTNELRVWVAEGSRVSYIKYPTFTNNRYDWSSAEYDINGGSLICSWWDGGLKDALKFWNRFTLIADIPADTSIEIYAARDGEDWRGTTDYIFLGELKNEHLTDNGEYTVMFPDGTVAKSIQPIFILNTNNSSKTPRIKAYNIESLVRQIPVYTYTFRVLLANNITKMDGTTESARTADDMWEELQRAAMQNAPIIISFPMKSVRGVISYLREETVQFTLDGMDNEVWERVAVVTVVEAT